MSGHNPHSRLSQPVNSSSWNHLQVPSYMPRQPQLAHMSSERTLRSSPLIWPNTNPADAFYNYMALTAAAAVANSNPKNTALDINPLLSFVRTPSNAMPFNSVDLSLPPSAVNPNLNQTAAVSANANRNSLTPSPRNLVSPGSGSSSSARFPKLTSDSEESANNGTNKMDVKLNTDPIAFLNEMSEQIASMRSSRNMAPSNAHSRDSNPSHNDLSNFRINGGNDKSKQRNEPMELVREPNAANPFDNESLSNSVHLQQLLGLAAPITSSITPNLNDLSKSLLSIFNNTSPTPPLLVSPKSSSNYHRRQTSDTSKNCLNALNDESLDSQSGTCNEDDAPDKQQNTRYRRRKPQKTIRMPNELSANETISTTLDSDKNNIANANECHKNDNNATTNNSNGINFPPFHSESSNNLLPQTNLIVPPPLPPPQTQSIDLSHHCANQELFENGLVNYSKTNDLDLLNSTTAGGGDKGSNLLQNHEINGLNVFGAMNLSHLRNTNLTNDIATFPNTDDLVKKVEELVKCNEQNGFDDTDFEPMELTKSQAKKLVSDDENRIANGIPESLTTANSIEHVNNHSNVVKCNGNGISPATMPTVNEIIETKAHENDEVKLPSALPSTTIPNPIQNGEMKAANTDIDAGEMFDGQNNAHVDTMDKNSMPTIFSDNGAVDMIYDKSTNDINNQSANSDSSVVANTSNESTSRINSIEINEIAMEVMSTSHSESPTPKKKPASKKKPRNRTAMGKPSKKNNQNKNAKFNDKSEKKSDSKKAKARDDATMAANNDAVNKFRGPYVHVARDGTLDVINAPLTEEIAEKQSKFKKNYISHKADRNKVRGLHVSTLSHKYDAVTTDISWMCVFCKLGPHKYGLGDLFGPFILLTDNEDFHLAQSNTPNDGGFWKSHQCKMAYSHNISAVAAKSTHSKTGNAGNATMKKKRKLEIGTQLSHSSATAESIAPANEIDIFYGMTQANDSSYEVWAHEDCIVWASGVHIIGARVVGLDAAVWGSVRHQCNVCKQYGAMLSCLKRNCNNEVHVPCAKRFDWQLNERSFQSRCSEHSLNNESIIHEDSN